MEPHLCPLWVEIRPTASERQWLTLDMHLTGNAADSGVSARGRARPTPNARSESDHPAEQAGGGSSFIRPYQAFSSSVLFETPTSHQPTTMEFNVAKAPRAPAKSLSATAKAEATAKLEATAKASYERKHT